MKRVPLLILLFALCLAFSPPVAATTMSVTNGSSTLVVDPTGGGAVDWFVDGQDFLYQQWFWYRIGDSGPASPVNALGLDPSASSAVDDTIRLTYGSTSGLQIVIKYVLTGMPVGSSRWSDVAETIRINNFGQTALDVHFFQYSDFDLNGIGSSDSVQIVNGGRVSQTSLTGGPLLNETIITPEPDHFEAALFDQTLTRFASAGFTNLNDHVAAGPGDATWAFQWERNLGRNSGFIISKDRQLRPVPEPAAIALLGGVLLAVASRLRKRLA